MKTWQEQRANTIANMWYIKNNHPGRFESGGYKEFEEDLYSFFAKYQEEIISMAIVKYNNICNE